MTTLYDLPFREKREERMDRFWINWVEGTDGGRRYRWYSLKDAENEAERLAKLPDVQGKNVYVLEYIEKCRVKMPVEWDGPDV